MPENTENCFNDPELEISLSQIEVGCIPYVFQNENFLLFKDKKEKINILKEFNSINIRFENIERPEFPTISASVFINTKKNINIKYEYFFLTESEIELNYLKLLNQNRQINVYFINDFIESKALVKITEDETAKLNAILSL